MIQDIILILSKVKNSRPEEYRDRVSLYIGMRDGGDGGPFRNSNKSIRELHFIKWKDGDFQVILEALNETPVLSDEERSAAFEYENKKSVFKKIINLFSNNKRSKKCPEE